MSNQLLRGGWPIKAAHAKRWKGAVALAVRNLAPARPLKTATLTLVRVSASEPDYDGLVSGFKPIIDGLVASRIIETDKRSCIGVPKYEWRKGKRGQGSMLIRIEAAITQDINPNAKQKEHT